MQSQPEVSHLSPKCEPGLFTEFTPRQALARYINGQWVRFHDGQPQKIGGYVAANLTGVTDAGGYTHGIIGVPRASHLWTDLNGQEWLALGTGEKLYLVSQGQLYDITPLRRQIALTNAIATTSGSAVVTITDAFNNAANGDYVNISGATTYNGITLNGQYKVINATTNTYQVTAHQTATGNGAGGGGTISVQYDVTAGLDYPGFYYGWGAGVWSQGTWGTPRTPAGQSNTVGGTTYVGAVLTGNITINGTNTGSITTTGVQATDLAAVAAAINAISGTTGVTATVASSSGRITLSNTTGATITVAYTTLTPAATGVAAAGTYFANMTGLVQPIQLWALSNWGQGLMASIRNGSVYYWDRETGPQARAVSISLNPQFVTSSGAPVNTLWTLVSPTNQQLVCLGASHDGVNDGLYIAISDSDDYTNFTPAATNSAYTGRLSSGSKIVSAVNTRSGIFIMTDTAAFLLQNNAASVFSSEQIGENTTIFSPNSMVDVNGEVYLMGLRKLYMYDGVLRELPCDVWSQVFNNFNYSLPDTVTAWHNDQWSEVWWFYPSAGATENDSYVVYNYREKHWTFGTLQRTTGCITSNYYNFPLACDASGNLWEHENGYDAVNGITTAIPAFVQTFDMQTVQRTPYGAITPGRGLAYNEGAEQIHVSFIVPDINELVGDAYITLQTKRYPRDAYVTRGPYPITPSTDLLSVRARGKLVNMTFGSTGIGCWWRIGNMTLGLQDDGEK